MEEVTEADVREVVATALDAVQFIWPSTPEDAERIGAAFWRRYLADPFGRWRRIATFVDLLRSELDKTCPIRLRRNTDLSEKPPYPPKQML